MKRLLFTSLMLDTLLWKSADDNLFVLSRSFAVNKPLICSSFLSVILFRDTEYSFFPYNVHKYAKCASVPVKSKICAKSFA